MLCVRSMHRLHVYESCSTHHAVRTDCMYLKHAVLIMLCVHIMHRLFVFESCSTVEKDFYPLLHSYLASPEGELMTLDLSLKNGSIVASRFNLYNDIMYRDTEHPTVIWGMVALAKRLNMQLYNISSNQGRGVATSNIFFFSVDYLWYDQVRQ
jgi:hypothetical protein